MIVKFSDDGWSRERRQHKMDDFVVVELNSCASGWLRTDTRECWSGLRDIENKQNTFVVAAIKAFVA